MEQPQKSTHLCRQILRLARHGQLAGDYIREVSRLIVDFVGCDAVGVRIVDRNRFLRCEALLGVEEPLSVEILHGKKDKSGVTIPVQEVDSPLERLCDDVISGRRTPATPGWTAEGSYWTGDIGAVVAGESDKRTTGEVESGYKTVAIMPFATEDRLNGLLVLKSRKESFFDQNQIEAYEDSAKMLGIAWSQRRTQIALRGRVKELTCLHGIAKLASAPGESLENTLGEAAELLPATWLYPDIASARIEFAGQNFQSGGFAESPFMQVTDIVVGDKTCGSVTVAYSEMPRELDEGPFLKEERRLIEAIATELAIIIEAKRMEQEAEALHEQLRHADRLATIGNLAAGLAHELNEPLVSILGRAQLIEKMPGLPDQAVTDNNRIVAAALHAREIISKLKLFARQAPRRTETVSLNDIVRDGLFLVESRCQEANVELVQNLSSDEPLVEADRGQLYQVLVNLVVNAEQASSGGDRITIRTELDGNEAVLSVDDTGSGIEPGTIEKIFTPFFTTKENEGTGLGLAVVQGIVVAHRGEIKVASKSGRGTRFEVRLPSVTSTLEAGDD